MRISEIKVDNLINPIGIDNNPLICWVLQSDRNNTVQAEYSIHVTAAGKAVWSDSKKSDKSLYHRIGGELKPYTRYDIVVRVTDNYGNIAEASTFFESGKMADCWQAKWIRANCSLDDDEVCPPYIFQKGFSTTKAVVSARIYSTALGCYVLSINNQRVSDEYFAPGYTQYDKQLQYNSYDVTSLLSEGGNILQAEVCGGWYAGRLGLYRNGNHYGKHRALMLELHIRYADGTVEVVVTDGTWRYTADGCRRFAGFFDGESFDARRTDSGKYVWQQAITDNFAVNIVPYMGVPVRRHDRVSAVKITDTIYDFGKNFAGFVHIKIKAVAGACVSIRHAEILHQNELYIKSLRTAKARLDYTATDGVQEYEPLFTYMGFRYAEVLASEGVEILEIYGVELYSDIDMSGKFQCSNPLINTLCDNIITSQKANFMDIPTDCPQRDERCGWTGDIAVFVSTAAFNADVNRFLSKWLRDLSAAQLKSGSVPVIVPNNNIRYTSLLRESVWGDSSVMVPWALYLSSGDISVLERQYESMSRYMRYVQKRCARFSFGAHRYIWSGLHMYGDWLAPDCGFHESLFRGKWTATAYYAHSASIMSQVAALLNKSDDAEKYARLTDRVKAAFNRFFVRNGRLKKRFQSNYVLALQFGLLEGEVAQNAVADLVKDIEAHGNHLTTGFVGTPFLPFALSDNGRSDKAFELLLQDTCPSWLYTVKAGGTSIWERWDGLMPDGTIKLSGSVGNMTSFNHYAYGTIGDWLYKRVAGIQAVEAGYKSFSVSPTVGGGLTGASATHKSPYGIIAVDWSIKDGKFVLQVTVPANTSCRVTLPDGQAHAVGSGEYCFSCDVAMPA